ncbi:creatininase family protein [Robertmurraya yapensis]|uniref:Creatininase family protein n=1 Tax=Bacillus yapensis TaxID=2492960 RepID=A0A431VXG6_9BACI|nr:creatininase family protein [Bacillus yapensis]RTR27833.1 creatininase family protein [Bacillus yapensis]TKS94236.1 creatininase family protein [Bacillus yapensis]
MNAIEIHGRDLSLLENARFAVVPLGSFEYHGPHSPLGTDIFLADGFANLIDPNLGGIIFPTVPYTACPGKTNKYKGTISVRPSIIQEYLIDIMMGIMEQGIKKVVLLNAHDGNMGVSRTISEYVTGKYSDASFLLVNWWQMVAIDAAEEIGFEGTKGRGHGGPFEMSAVKAFRPDLVRVNKEDQELKEVQPLSLQPYILVEGTPKAWDGYTGLIQQSSHEKGKKIVEKAIANMNELIKNWLEN